MRKVKCKRIKWLEGLDMPLITGEDAKILMAFQSPYQLIEIVRLPSGEKALMLDGEVQYVEGKVSREYHLAHANMLLKCPENTKKIAIIGGGDGILAGILAKRYPHAQIYVFELDPCMVYIYSKYERDVNYDAFHQKNVNVILGDAFKSIKKFPDGYFDAIFVDLPDALGEEKSELYSEENFRLLAKKLKLDGCMSIYTGGIDPADFYLLILPDCFVAIGEKTVVGFFGNYGRILQVRKVSACD